MRNTFFKTDSSRTRRSSISRGIARRSAIAAFACGLALTSIGGPANAATSSGTMAVSATIISSCVITGATLDFGSINPIASSGPINSSSPFLVKCTNGTPYSVAFGDGTHAGPGTHTRNLQNASGARDLLPYQVYLDIGRTAVWGTAAGELGTATGNGLDQTVTVFAQIPDASTMSPGSYSDSLTLTVTY